MNHKIHIRVAALVVAILLFPIFILGCDDFVEAGQPNSQLTNTAVFDDITTADAAMTDIYAQMRENGLVSGKIFGLSALLGSYTDELVSYQTGSGSSAEFYNNSLLASNSYIAIQWNNSYNQVYASNAVIEGTANAVLLPEIAKDRLRGEALFVRAFTHFNLVNVFGAIPYVTSTDYITNSTIMRMPVSTVYQNIITDLENAILLLPEEYTQFNRTRPNKAVAKALLARVFLYNGNNAEAANMASSVINDETTYQWETNLDNIFLQESTTTIWQLAPGSFGENTQEGATFIFQAGPPALVSLSENFVAQFEPGDQRKIHWIQEVTNGTDTWYHSFKYKQFSYTGNTLECSIVFRLAEQYLIRAEARARQGELISARDDINKIRTTAGLPATTATSQEGLLDAILSERRSELFTEHGHRFFDLKRFSRLNEVLGTKPGWSGTDNLWPLPQNELQSNPLLAPQNPGY